MDEDNFKNILKMDFPDITIDSKKIISLCQEREKKHKKNVIRLTYILSSLVVIIGTIFLSVYFINNSTSSDIKKINNSILNLDKIENDEAKMLEIMNIEEDIKTISADKQSKIYKSKLAYQTSKTINSLKSSVEWKEYLDNKDDYVLLNEIIDKEKIIEIYLSTGFNSEQFVSRDSNYINELLSIFELAYSNVEDKDGFLNDYSNQLGDYSKSYYIRCQLKDDTDFTTINVYQSGYVVISKYKKMDNDGYYSIEYDNIMVSLVNLNNEELGEYINNGKSSLSITKYENIKYKDIEDTNATGIIIYYDNQLYDTIYELNLINNFLYNFKDIEMKEIKKIIDSTSSLSVDYSEEYLELLEELDNAYTIKVMYAESEYYFYISNSGYLYIDNSLECLKSTQGIYNLQKILEEINK